MGRMSRMKDKLQDSLPEDRAHLEVALSILKHYRPILLRRALNMDKDSDPVAYQDEWLWMESYDALMIDLGKRFGNAD